MGNNIPRLFSSIKKLLAGDVYVVFLVVLVGLASFGLGRLSVRGETLPVVIKDSQAAGVQVPRDHTLVESGGDGVPTVVEGTYVASKSSTKYHLPWCPGAQRIKESNKIWFDSKEAAEQAGYSPAANCKGIE